VIGRIVFVSTGNARAAAHMQGGGFAAFEMPAGSMYLRAGDAIRIVTRQGRSCAVSDLATGLALVVVVWKGVDSLMAALHWAGA
jgi:hypothetical protein